MLKLLFLCSSDMCTYSIMYDVLVSVGYHELVLCHPCCQRESAETEVPRLVRCRGRPPRERAENERMSGLPRVWREREGEGEGEGERKGRGERVREGEERVCVCGRIGIYMKE